jgi:Asp-tRNA(Asn)/Glu-tRNA(Gln) amidotransferase A subunit family amidase
MSIPAGKDPANGLPIGMQLMAAPLREDLIFRAAYSSEQA